MLVEIGLSGAAAFLFGRGIYHSGVLAGWTVQGLSQRDDHCADCQDAGVCLHNRRCQKSAPTTTPWLDYCRQAEAQEAEMYRQVPSAFWLAPDGPLAPLPAPALPATRWRIRVPANPRCPVCEDGGTVGALAVHGGEVSMWDCFDCGAEFTRKGETRKSRKARLAREAQTLAEIAAAKAAEETKRLPCGCMGDVRTRAYPTGGWDMGRYAECVTCGGTWDYAPKYGESGNPRKMHPRSGPAEWPNGNKLTDPPR